MDKKYNGWGCVSLLVDAPLEHINNPRPIFLKAVEEEKQFITHFCNDRGIGVCGGASMPHSGFMEDSVTSYWKAHWKELEGIGISITTEVLS